MQKTNTRKLCVLAVLCAMQVVLSRIAAINVGDYLKISFGFIPIAVCGIGDPERFRSDLDAYGTPPARLVAAPDHCKNFETLLLEAIRDGQCAVITEKDAARLSEGTVQNSSVFVARQETSVSDEAFEAISALFSK